MQLAKHSQSHKNSGAPGNWDASPPVVSAPEQLWISSLLIQSPTDALKTRLCSLPSRIPSPWTNNLASSLSLCRGVSPLQGTRTQKPQQQPGCSTAHVPHRREEGWSLSPTAVLLPGRCPGVEPHSFVRQAIRPRQPLSPLSAPHWLPPVPLRPWRALPHNLHVIRLPPSWGASKSRNPGFWAPLSSPIISSTNKSAHPCDHTFSLSLILLLPPWNPDSEHRPFLSNRYRTTSTPAWFPVLWPCFSGPISCLLFNPLLPLDHISHPLDDDNSDFPWLIAAYAW